jgi:hypothetical protein
MVEMTHSGQAVGTPREALAPTAIGYSLMVLLGAAALLLIQRYG